jgi:small subunit ribosomal protein S16
LNGERINYWVSVGAQPSVTVQVLIKKYGVGGTHLAAQQAALGRLAVSRRRPEPMPLLPRPSKPTKERKRPAKEEAVEVAVTATAEATATVEPVAAEPAAPEVQS